jgi:hypothetical protein
MSGRCAAVFVPPFGGCVQLPRRLRDPSADLGFILVPSVAKELFRLRKPFSVGISTTIDTLTVGTLLLALDYAIPAMKSRVLPSVPNAEISL